MREHGDALTPQEAERLMTVLGHRFAHPALLAQALTHPSYALQSGQEDNQRLEYLGDAVLQLCVTRRLFDRFPGMQEGQLSRRRAKLVCEASLCAAAARFGLGAALRMDRGEAHTGGREKPSVLADAMEAVIAAVYLDAGLEAAAALVDRTLGSYDQDEAEETDAKTMLQEHVQANGADAPRYEIISQEGPPHARVFTAQVYVGEALRGQGTGTSKKQAQQRAARQALAALGGAGDEGSDA